MISLSESPKQLKAKLRNLSSSDLRDLLEDLGPVACSQLMYMWEMWARDNQLEPEGEWSVWLLLAGRGWGKTRTGAETVRNWVISGRYGRIALVGADAADARDVMLEGDSGLLNIHPKHERPSYEPSKKKLTWPNGATAHLYSAEDPESLRGPQFDAAWSDELAKWKYLQETWDQLQFGMRLGRNPKQLITTTPKPLKILKTLTKRSDVTLTRGSTYENLRNLAPSFIQNMKERYEGTRLGRQELNAELLLDNPNAIFQTSSIDENRVEKQPNLDNIVIGLDPPVTGKASADTCGIVVVGHERRQGPDHFYILDDRSIQGRSPQDWAQRAVLAYREWGATAIVAEGNVGGDLIKTVIHSIDDNINVVRVHATVGKWARAEPIGGMYEQKRVHHVGQFLELEDEMTEFDASGTVKGQSPDRMDALVWGMTYLTKGTALGGPKLSLM